MKRKVVCEECGERFFIFMSSLKIETLIEFEIYLNFKCKKCGNINVFYIKE